MGWTIAFKSSEPGLREEITRVSHEDYGLVVASIQGDWARAVYGYHLNGEVRVGWVQLVPGRIVFVSYEDQLRQNEVYFMDPQRIEDSASLARRCFGSSSRPPPEAIRRSVR